MVIAAYVSGAGMVKGDMINISASLTIHGRDTEYPSGVKTLMDALEDFGRSRATKALIRFREESKVGCALRVPVMRDECPVNASAFGRALRRIMREAVEAASPGDNFVIDFRVASGSRLVVEARPADESTSALLKQMQGGLRMGADDIPPRS